MKKQQLKDLLGNKIFSAVFTKKNGEKRKIHARLNVKKHLKGGSKGYEKENLLTVFDLLKREYRTINIETLELVKFKGNILNLKVK